MSRSVSYLSAEISHARNSSQSHILGGLAKQVQKILPNGQVLETIVSGEAKLMGALSLASQESFKYENGRVLPPNIMLSKEYVSGLIDARDLFEKALDLLDSNKVLGSLPNLIELPHEKEITVLLLIRTRYELGDEETSGMIDMLKEITPANWEKQDMSHPFRHSISQFSFLKVCLEGLLYARQKNNVMAKAAFSSAYNIFSTLTKVHPIHELKSLSTPNSFQFFKYPQCQNHVGFWVDELVYRVIFCRLSIGDISGCIEASKQYIFSDVIPDEVRRRHILLLLLQLFSSHPVLPCGTVPSKEDLCLFYLILLDAYPINYQECSSAIETQYLQVTECLLRRNEVQRALDVCQHALRRGYKTDSILKRFANILWDTNEKAHFLIIVDQIDNADIHLLVSASEYCIEMDTQRAIAYAMRLDKIKTSDAYVEQQCLLGRIYRQMGDNSFLNDWYQKATQCFTNALHTNANHLKSLYHFALHDALLGKIPEALNIIKELVGIDANDFKAWHLMILLYSALNEDATARRTCLYVESYMGEREKNSFNRIDLLITRHLLELRKGDIQLSLETLKSALVIWKQAFGNFIFQEDFSPVGVEEKNLESLAVVEIDSKNIEIDGKCTNMNKPSSGIEDSFLPCEKRKMLLLLRDIWLALARLNIAAGEREESEYALKEIVKIGVIDADVLFAIGQYYSKTNSSLAEAYFERAISLDNRHFEAHLKLASIAKDQGHRSRAMVLCERLLKMDPHCAHGLFLLGKIYKESCVLDKAKQCFERALIADKFKPIRSFRIRS